MARPISYDKDKVLQKTMNLFWDKGYESVSVEDIMVNSNFNRNSFYKLFSNKNGAYLKSLEFYSNYTKNNVINCVGDKKGLKAIKLIFEMIVREYTNKNGCLLLNTLNTNLEIGSEIKEFARIQVENFEKLIYLKLVEAIELGEICDKKNIKVLSKLITTTIQGVRFNMKLMHDEKRAIEILDDLMNYIVL